MAFMDPKEDEMLCEARYKKLSQLASLLLAFILINSF